MSPERSNLAHDFVAGTDDGRIAAGRTAKGVIDMPHPNHDGLEHGAGPDGRANHESSEPAATYRVTIDGGPPEAALDDMHLLNGVDDGSRRKVQLLVAELIAESGDQGEGNGAGGLEVELLPRLVRVTTTSTSGFLSDADRDPLGEWGLMIVERVADRWGVEDDGRGDRCVWFEIDRGAG
jgi:hypothetical protein